MKNEEKRHVALIGKSQSKDTFNPNWVKRILANLFMASFGSFIKDQREKLGWTQTDLGARLGINSGAISKIEHGRKQLSTAKLLAVAQLFNIEIIEIKKLYFAEKIAKEAYKNECPECVFEIAASVFQDMSIKNVKQGTINF